jgi:hypothetical protein
MDRTRRTDLSEDGSRADQPDRAGCPRSWPDAPSPHLYVYASPHWGGQRPHLPHRARAWSAEILPPRPGCSPAASTGTSPGTTSGPVAPRRSRRNGVLSDGEGQEERAPTRRYQRLLTRGRSRCRPSRLGIMRSRAGGATEIVGLLPGGSARPVGTQAGLEVMEN